MGQQRGLLITTKDYSDPVRLLGSLLLVSEVFMRGRLLLKDLLTQPFMELYLVSSLDFLSNLLWVIQMLILSTNITKRILHANQNQKRDKCLHFLRYNMNHE